MRTKILDTGEEKEMVDVSAQPVLTCDVPFGVEHPSALWFCALSNSVLFKKINFCKSEICFCVFRTFRSESAGQRENWNFIPVAESFAVASSFVIIAGIFKDHS